MTTTIAAIGTPPGEGGIGIVRLSGPAVWRIADKIFKTTGPKPSQRKGGTFVYGIVQSSSGETLERALLLTMRAPHSYTGEDCVEIHGHGGAICMRRILRRALEAGAHTAEPGEFTKRAFLNGKMDLLQSEAVADLIQAHSERAASAALEQMGGQLSRSFNSIYDELMGIASNLEATLDFSEEELPRDLFSSLSDKLAGGCRSLENLLNTWDEGHLLRDGAQVIILGQPNVGKSTLMNSLLGRERAIVTDIAGTTRDILEESLTIDGIPLRLVDTAGLRESDCKIEQEGIRRTRKINQQADLSIYLLDNSQILQTEDKLHLENLDPETTILVLNKTDLGTGLKKDLEGTILEEFSTVPASLLNGEGILDIRQALAEKLERGINLNIPPHAVISERHRELLNRALRESEKALELLEKGYTQNVAFASEHLREALEQLGEATGKVYHENLLENIFSRFCVGK